LPEKKASFQKVAKKAGFKDMFCFSVTRRDEVKEAQIVKRQRLELLAESDDLASLQLARHLVAKLPRQSLCRDVLVPEMSLLVNMVRFLRARGVFVLNL
ncbi:hypothetical protein KCU71_g156, partial [Aureobasidium melanogenum]